MNGTAGPAAAPAKQAAFGSNEGLRNSQKQQQKNISSTADRGRAKVSLSPNGVKSMWNDIEIVLGPMVFPCKLASLADSHSDCLGRTISTAAERNAGDGRRRQFGFGILMAAYDKIR